MDISVNKGDFWSNFGQILVKFWSKISIFLKRIIRPKRQRKTILN